MSCEQAAELLPAFALDALDGPERELLEAHLRRCPACAREQRALSEVASQLALGVPQAEPPPDLRGRVLSLAAARPGTRGQEATAAEESSRDRRVPVSPHRARWLQRWAPAVSLVSLVAALAALLWGAGLQAELGQTRTQSAETGVQLERARGSYGTIVRVLASVQTQVRDLQPSEAAPDAQGKLWIDPASGQGMMMARDLPRLPEDRSYQVWLVNGQERVSPGLLRENDEGIYYLVIQPPDKLTDYQRLGVTQEPAGGSPGPTGPRVIGANL